MTLEEQIRGRIKEVGFSSEEGRFLRTVLGEIQLEQHRPGFKEEKALAVVKKMLAGNTESLGLLPVGDERIERLKVENAILESFLPSYWSEDQVSDGLSDIAEEIKAAQNDGKAVGVAMKHLKAKNAPVEGNTVKEVVARIRA